jgi:phosphopantothenoylcysteine synthetase/decarboxylase
MVNGGQQSLNDWLWKQRTDGASFRTIADRLSAKVGFPVSHEAVRQWMKV